MLKGIAGVFFFFILLLMCPAAAAAVAANSLDCFALKRDVMLMCHSGSAADPSHRRSNKCCSLKVVPATNQAATMAAAGLLLQKCASFLLCVCLSSKPKTEKQECMQSHTAAGCFVFFGSLYVCCCCYLETWCCVMQHRLLI